MFALKQTFFPLPQPRLKHIHDISNTDRLLNPVFKERKAQKSKRIIAYEYVYLLNDKEKSTYRLSSKYQSWHEADHNALIRELREDYIPFCVSRKEAKNIKPIVEFPRLVPLAKSLNLVTIMIWHDKVGNKYEFAMRLIYAKERQVKGKR